MKMDAQTLKRRVTSRVGELDAMPTVFRKLLEVLNSAYPSPRELGQIIATDQSLSIRVLRMVNSAAYGLTGNVMSVNQAVNLLGINVVRSLTCCLASYDSFFHRPDAQRATLWRRSLGVGLVARRLAERAKLKNPEEAFVAGMLHDVGRALLAKHCPREYAMVEARRIRGAQTLEAELQVLGATHAEVGAWACESWRLPTELVESVRFHHTPLEAGPYVRAASIVHIADNLWLEACSPEDPELSLWQPQAMAGFDFTTEVMDQTVNDSFGELAELESYVAGHPVEPGHSSGARRLAWLQDKGELRANIA